MPTDTTYLGRVHRQHVDATGVMDAQGAAAVLLDAWHCWLALAAPAAAGAGPRPDPDTLRLQRLAGPAPALGQTLRCRRVAGAAADRPDTLHLVLDGPAGAAWAGRLRCADVDPAALDAAHPAADALGLPPVLGLRRMKAEHGDQAGHVNVQVFLDLVDDAVGVMGQDAAPGAGRQHIVQARMTLKSELFCGDVVSVHSGVRTSDPMGQDLVHAIVHQPSGRLACVVETRLAALSPAGQPAGQAAQPARPHQPLQDWPALPLARPLADPRAGPQPIATAIPTCLAVVDAWDADPAGWLQPRALVNLCSTGARQYLARIGLDAGRMAADAMTVAAVDYAIDIHQRPRLGCNLTLLSAPLAVSAKSIRFSHHLVDSQSGTVYATVEIVGVMLDLRSHRSMAVPADVRSRLAPTPAAV